MERPEVCEAVIHIITSTTYTSKIEFALSIVIQQLVSAYGVACSTHSVSTTAVSRVSAQNQHRNPTNPEAGSLSGGGLEEHRHHPRHEEEKTEELESQGDGANLTPPTSLGDNGIQGSLQGIGLEAADHPRMTHHPTTSEKQAHTEQRHVSVFTESVALLLKTVLGDQFSLLALVHLMFETRTAARTNKGTHCKLEWLNEDLRRRVIANRQEMRVGKEIMKMFNLVHEYW
jgi:hypothetical protein